MHLPTEEHLLPIQQTTSVRADRRGRRDEHREVGRRCANLCRTAIAEQHFAVPGGLHLEAELAVGACRCEPNGHERSSGTLFKGLDGRAVDRLPTGRCEEAIEANEAPGSRNDAAVQAPNSPPDDPSMPLAPFNFATNDKARHTDRQPRIRPHGESKRRRRPVGPTAGGSLVAGLVHRVRPEFVRAPSGSARRPHAQPTTSRAAQLPGHARWRSRWRASQSLRSPRLSGCRPR